MKTHPTFHIFLLLALAALAAALPAAAGAEDAGIPGADFRLLAPARVGVPVTARFDLKGYTLPPGCYASVNIDFPERPEGMEPWVRPGCPDTVLTFHSPGRHRLRVILNQVSKPSCGGVNARLLLERTLDVDVAP